MQYTDRKGTLLLYGLELGLKLRIGETWNRVL